MIESISIQDDPFWDAFGSEKREQDSKIIPKGIEQHNP